MNGEEEMPSYDLVMPFVTVASKGGPHDDESYTAGWEMGCMDSALGAIPQAALTAGFQIREANKAQADLIAMHHGWEIVQEHGDLGWLCLDLRRSDGPS